MCVMIKTFETAHSACHSQNKPSPSVELVDVFGCNPHYPATTARKNGEHSQTFTNKLISFLGAMAGESNIRLPGCTSFDSTPRWPSLAVRVGTRRPWNLRRSPFGRVKQGAGTRWRWKKWHATWPRNIGIIVMFSLILEEFEVSLDGTFWCWTYPTWRDHLMLKYLDLLWNILTSCDSTPKA